jgi:hypothetical protein
VRMIDLLSFNSERPRLFLGGSENHLWAAVPFRKPRNEKL